MSLNVVSDHSPFAASSSLGPSDPAAAADPAASPFSPANAFHGDFLDLSLQGDDHLWGLGPISPPVTWGNAKHDPHYHQHNHHSHHDQQPDHDFSNSPLDHDLKNTRVRNGQPTPPLYDDDQHHDKAKREKFLERNRLAASKCRQKKKEHTMLLESRYKEQSDKKEKLVAEIARLRSEILGLKNEVLKHAQCGDEPIKLHLAQMVKKITYKDSPSDSVNEVADAGSMSESPPKTPVGQASMSFGFDDPLHLDHASSALAQGLESSFDPQLRRESEASLVSNSSYAFSTDDNFDNLINF